MSKSTPTEGILLGYFAKAEEAGDACRRLKRRGFRRFALLSRSAGGDLRSQDPFPLNRVIAALAAAVLLGLLCTGASFLLGWSMPEMGAAGAFAGLLFGFAWRRRSRHGVERGLLKQYGRLLVPDQVARRGRPRAR